jgi:hypothetical protein
MTAKSSRFAAAARDVLTPVCMVRSLIVLALMVGTVGAEPTVKVRTAKDNSHAVTETESKKHEEVMRRTIERLVARAPIKLDANRNVDASLVTLTTDMLGSTAIVTATLQLVVSDDNGRITSVLGTSAKVEAMRGSTRLASLREEAIVGALESGYAKVKDRLHGKQRVVASLTR